MLTKRQLLQRINLFIVLFLLSGNISLAQLDTRIDSIITEHIFKLKELWTNEYQHIHKGQKKIGFDKIDSIFYPVDTSALFYFNSKLNALKIRKLQLDPGLSFHASYRHNFSEIYTPDEDDFFYYNRYQAEIRFNMIKNGYLQNRYKIKTLAFENKLNNLNKGLNQKNQNYLFKRNYIIFLFNQQKINIIKRNIDLLTKKVAITRVLNTLRYLTKEDHLNYLAVKSDYEAKLFSYSGYNKQLEYAMKNEKQYDGNFPVFDINVEELMNLLPDIDTLMYLEKEKLFWKNKSPDISLHSFIRYNLIDDISKNKNYRDYFSAGLGLSFPVPLNYNVKNKINQIEMEKIDFKYFDENERLQLYLMNLIYEFKYKLKQYVNFHEKKTRYYERIRQDRVIFKFDEKEFNPLHALSSLEEINSIELEMADILQQLYLLGLKIYTNLPNERLTDFAKEFDMNSLYNEYAPSSLTMYIWSKSFEKYSPDFILEYLQYNGIKSAAISVHNNSKPSVFESIKEFAKQGIQTEILIGKNSLLFTDISEYLNGLFTHKNAGNKLFIASAIHIDIEPHTLKDWSSKSIEYMQQYVLLLHGAKVFCNEHNMKLHVSIPVFYKPQHLEQIFNIADKVFLMAYETQDINKIRQRLEQEFKLDNKKIVIAYRALDFSNKVDLDKHIENSRKTFKTNQFALHEFNTIIELEEKTLFEH